MTVSLATGIGSGGDAEGDTLTGIEQVYGSAFDDHLTGDAGANRLWGSGGNDTLMGGVGADVLKGGAGNDIFVYTGLADSTVAAAGKDTIADFTAGDRIDLSAIDADGNAANGDTAAARRTPAADPNRRSMDHDAEHPRHSRRRHSHRQRSRRSAQPRRQRQHQWPGRRRHHLRHRRR